MPQGVKLRRKRRQYVIGDLDKRITLHTRTAQAPKGTSIQAVSQLDQKAKTWASITSKPGGLVFGGVDVGDVAITHEMGIRWRPVTTADWLEFDGRNFDIITIDGLEERREFLTLFVRERGAKIRQATTA